MTGETVRVRVEVSRFAFVKRGPDDRIEFVSFVPCPFNYGSVLGTMAADGDPLDALVLGPRLRRGEVVTTLVRGEVLFVDEGLVDTKLVCSARAPSMGERALVDAFFRLYAAAKRARSRAHGSRAVTRYEGLVWRERPGA